MDELRAQIEHTLDIKFELKTTVPVFDIDDALLGHNYPCIWITERAENGEGEYSGRTYVMVYPFDRNADSDGWEALDYGGDYYDEGMTYADASDHQTRVECFKAAELLYLHAADKGNPYAWLCLGYLYHHDRCEGVYYDCWMNGVDSFPREQRAFECFKKAADAGIVEAMYKLGDMYKHGSGCSADMAAAFDCYMRAFAAGREDKPYIWGSIALRLGDAFENGYSCNQSFSRALEWYNQAVTGLEIAVRSGDWYYENALAKAHDGVKRCRQECAFAD